MTDYNGPTGTLLLIEDGTGRPLKRETYRLIQDPGAFEGMPEYLPAAAEEALSGFAEEGTGDLEEMVRVRVPFKGLLLEVTFWQDDHGFFGEWEHSPKVLGEA